MRRRPGGCVRTIEVMKAAVGYRQFSVNSLFVAAIAAVSKRRERAKNPATCITSSSISYDDVAFAFTSASFGD